MISEYFYDNLNKLTSYLVPEDRKMLFWILRACEQSEMDFWTAWNLADDEPELLPMSVAVPIRWAEQRGLFVRMLKIAEERGVIDSN